jgi:hypothetical protein
MAKKFRFDGWVKSAQGAAVPGSQIYICSQPANTSAAPPTPLATVYSDVNGLIPVTQPMITDGFGHYDCYVAAGRYTIVVALGAVIQQIYEDQVPMGSSVGGTDSTPLIEVNGTPIQDQDTLNLVSTASVILSNPSGGNVEATSGGVISVAGKTGVVTLVEGDVTNLTSDLAAKAPLASPALTGVPTVPTAAPGTNTTQAASCAFVLANAGGSTFQVTHKLTTAELLALDAFGGPNNITLVAAPGANKVIVPFQTSMFYVSGGIAFANQGEIDVGLSSASNGFYYGARSAFGFMDSTTNKSVFYMGQNGNFGSSPLADANAVNKPLKIFNDYGSPFITGNGYVVISVLYAVVDIS